VDDEFEKRGFQD